MTEQTTSTTEPTTTQTEQASQTEETATPETKQDPFAKRVAYLQKQEREYQKQRAEFESRLKDYEPRIKEYEQYKQQLSSDDADVVEVIEKISGKSLDDILKRYVQKLSAPKPTAEEQLEQFKRELAEKEAKQREQQQAEIERQQRERMEAAQKATESRIANYIKTNTSDLPNLSELGDDAISEVWQYIVGQYEANGTLPSDFLETSIKDMEEFLDRRNKEQFEKLAAKYNKSQSSSSDNNSVQPTRAIHNAALSQTDVKSNAQRLTREQRLERAKQILQRN